jgi:hypothetical protein
MRAIWNMIAVLLYCLLFWAVATFVGCATATVETPDVKITYNAVLRDLKYDPNGIEIKTSPTAEGIVTGVVGLVVGLFL